MKVVNPDPVLEITLEEFWNEYWSKEKIGVVENLENAATVFRGESEIRPRFRIPSADGKTDIFFNSRELLCRFANFTTPEQARFLNSIRQALKAAAVRRMVITIPWSKNGTRQVNVRASAASVEHGTLDFEMQ